MVNGKYEDTPVGTPQGGNPSPLLSNVMLNELDKELEVRGLRLSRIRVIIWKQWKVSNKRIKTLIQLGIPEGRSKRINLLSKRLSVHRIFESRTKRIANKRLKQRRFPSALEQFLKVHTVI